jgi:hypothetical protein
VKSPIYRRRAHKPLCHRCGSKCIRIKRYINEYVSAYCFLMPTQQSFGYIRWLGIRLICQSGATCLPVDCCFSELALLKIQLSIVGLEQSDSHHHFNECNLFNFIVFGLNPLGLKPTMYRIRGTVNSRTQFLLECIKNNKK